MEEEIRHLPLNTCRQAEYRIIIIISKIQIPSSHTLVSFDVESLFFNVPVQDTLLKPVLSDSIIDLLHHCLSSSYFQFDQEFFKHSDGLAMGSLLSSVVANFFTEHFEKQVLESATLKPTQWFRYVDDTFVIWPHDLPSLYEFLNHLNNIHPKIKFTIEMKMENALPFLNVLVQKLPSGDLAHSVYRKSAHTIRYLQL